MKKLLSMMMVLMLILSLLVGCGGSEASTAESTAPQEPSSASEEAVEAPAEAAPLPETEEVSVQEEAPPEEVGMTIEENEAMFPLEENMSYTIYYPFAPPLIMMGYENPAELNFFKTMEEMTNVTLDFTTVSVEAMEEQFNLLIAGGDYPDILSQCMDYYTGGFTAALEDEVIIDLAPYVEENAPHYKALMESDPDFKKYNYTDEGALPQFMSYYQDVYVNQGYFVNTQWLEEQDLESPVTYDDWYEVLKAFDSAYDMALPARAVPTSGFHGIAKDNFIVKGDEVVYLYADKELQNEFLAECMKWYEAGLYNDESLIDGYYTDSDLRGMVTAGDLMLSTADVDQYKVYQEEVPLAPVPLPVLNEGDTPYQVVQQSDAGNGNVITTDCENVETLVAYFDFWYSDAAILLANWGTEGETFTVGADGSYAWTEEVLNFAGGLNLATSVYAAGWEPTVLDWHRKDAAYNEDQLNAIEIWNNFDQSTNFPSFTTFTTEETEIISTTFTDITTYVDEHYTMFKNGEKNYETDYEAFLNTLYDMGLQDVIDVYQAAYDRYLAR